MHNPRGPNRMLLINGIIHTLDSELGVVSALALDGERILAAGSAAEIGALAGGQPEVVDLGGRAVIPGLTDAHIHFEWYARLLQNVDAETASLDECLARVEAKAATTAKGDWIIGHGWNQNVWGGEFPGAADLDRAAPEHPTLLTLNRVEDIAHHLCAVCLESAQLGIPLYLEL